jgi:hypothetical protein
MNDTAVMTNPEALRLVATDVTGIKKFSVTDVSPRSTVGELVDSLLKRMGLMTSDAGGADLKYRARLKRDGRNLHGSELVGDALVTDDEISLQPRINAGMQLTIDTD